MPTNLVAPIKTDISDIRALAEVSKKVQRR